MRVVVFDLKEDGEAVSDFPAYTYRLTEFGREMAWSREADGTFRDRERPDFFFGPAGDIREYVHTMRESPEMMEYVLCDNARHYRFRETHADGKRRPALIGSARCDRRCRESFDGLHRHYEAIDTEACLPREVERLLKRERRSHFWKGLFWGLYRLPLG